MSETIKQIVDEIQSYADRWVGVDDKMHHPDPAARLHSAMMLVDAEVIRRMTRMNEGKNDII